VMIVESQLTDSSSQSAATGNATNTKIRGIRAPTPSRACHDRPSPRSAIEYPRKTNLKVLNLLNKVSESFKHASRHYI
jgi:hypothetical protein